MFKPTARASRIAIASATPVAVLAAAALIWQSSDAAFTGTTRNSGNNWATGAVAITDDDAGAARFQVNNMVPGQTETKCITVTANADVPGTVKGYGINFVPSVHGLENYILIDVNAGTGGSFGSCAGFVSEQSIVTDAPLGQFASLNSYANGVGNWSVAAGTHSRTYQITWSFETTGLTQNQVDQLQGDHVGIDIQWELQSD